MLLIKKIIIYKQYALFYFGIIIMENINNNCIFRLKIKLERFMNIYYVM